MGENLKSRIVYTISLDIYLEIVKLAKKHGKQPGDSMQEEFEEILKKKRSEFELMGITDNDVDLLAGNLREQGLKVLNLKEIGRTK